MCVTNGNAFELMHEAIKNKTLTGFSDNKAKTFLVEKFSDQSIDVDNEVLANYLKKLRQKWLSVNRSKRDFEKRYSDWLSMPLISIKDDRNQGLQHQEVDLQLFLSKQLLIKLKEGRQQG